MNRMTIEHDPNDYPIHMSNNGGKTYLCGDKLSYTPPPVRLMSIHKASIDWHERRPLCQKCHAQSVAQTGEVVEWPPK